MEFSHDCTNLNDFNELDQITVTILIEGLAYSIAIDRRRT